MLKPQNGDRRLHSLQRQTVKNTLQENQTMTYNKLASPTSCCPWLSTRFIDFYYHYSILQKSRISSITNP